MDPYQVLSLYIIEFIFKLILYKAMPFPPSVLISVSGSYGIKAMSWSLLNSLVQEICSKEGTLLSHTTYVQLLHFLPRRIHSD